jgi:putative methyltransferase (TIGR04325 family)
MKIIRRLIERRIAPAVAEPRPQYGFFGDYSNFDDAAADASEYNSEKVAASAAAQIPSLFRDESCEIDGRYQQVHSALAAVADRVGKQRISVLDVGGGNGNNYLACAKMSPSVPYDWTIVETESMCAACGGLLPVVWTSKTPEKSFDAVLISGTLQYLPEPYAALHDFARKAPWLILHRTPIIGAASDRLTIQIVDPNIYPGELLRHWFLSGEKLRHSLQSLGTVAASWRNIQDDPAYVQIGALTFGFLVSTFTDQRR